MPHMYLPDVTGSCITLILMVLPRKKASASSVSAVTPASCSSTTNSRCEFRSLMYATVDKNDHQTMRLF
ncbi:hypothetical protein DPMN_032405 [Dreissena polymorpha]|uniref:Uncharacterized protein n=1 Tax=Dreissena polymorpha TaxID=45954 RepID=A0A9D4M1P5_DREPO|nr:hypothetical protein DPMN_032405 [Dreissena polymorpha]